MTGIDPVAQKLLYSIMQFNKGKWRQHKPHGRNHNEIMVLACLLHGAHPGERMDWRDNPPDFESHLNQEHPGLKVSEISALLRVKSPTITPVIRGLEDEGLVERTMDPEDRRAVRITITDAGRAIIRAAHEERMATFNRLVEHLGEADSLQLAELLSKVYTFFDTQVSPSSDSTKQGDETTEHRNDAPEQGDDTP
ncbi:MarR family transcriptional regulator [Paenibacillus barcinonensis]|uniref:MarR family transcriptional regulator n=1 Tax=Paenibacillus barcinonensis TaxID=198119 RepID=A0A2V4VZ75_PAEBA|nr:MarR family transcriptional regulator [Paenibacillus barcinonensis]PYE50850.1 DNA-binding MarR family transcriptional regulator [Paenibacillus barcinonensis]QKS57520.1 MarR family transcriptional regulator [Paenibacillus barcinonensis]